MDQNHLVGCLLDGDIDRVLKCDLGTVGCMTG